MESAAPLRYNGVPKLYEIGAPLPPCSSGTQHRIAVPAFRDTGEGFVIGSCLRCGAQKKYPKQPDPQFLKKPGKPIST